MELRSKKELYELWKQVQDLQEDYTAVVRICREKTCKIKPKLGLKLASVVSEKGFLKYINRERSSKQNIGPYLFKKVTRQIGMKKKWHYSTLFCLSL